MMSIYSFVL